MPLILLAFLMQISVDRPVAKASERVALDIHCAAKVPCLVQYRRSIFPWRIQPGRTFRFYPVVLNGEKIEVKVISGAGKMDVTATKEAKR